MNIPPIQPPAVHLSLDPPRPAQQAAQESARPVVAPPQTEAVTQETKRDEEKRAARQSHAHEPDSDGRELSEDEQRAVERLQQRDREVRAHEAAHKAAAGRHARGGASFEYEVGPDGKRYAVGGEVQIDTSKVSGDPQATIEKARIIQRAATAPAEPSAQDRRVALEAAAMEAAAQQELTEQRSATMNKFLASMPDESDKRTSAGSASHGVGQTLDVFA